MEPSLNIRSFRIGNLVYNPHLERIGYIAEITRADMTLFHGEMLIKEAGFYHEILAYIIHSGFISGYQNRYGDNLKPPTNVYHRMTA